jgi:CRP/FNR family cyclic AMP-dependent transcriptional regulator
MSASHPNFIWKDLFKPGKSEKKALIETLQDNILFKTLSRKELRYISNFVYERTYEPSEPVFQQGDRGIGMYIIAKGRVAIRIQNAETDVLVATLSEGSFFGEIALVDPNTVRTASAVAVEPTVAIGFFKPDLTEILERNPVIGVKILFQLATVLGKRLVETTELITVLKRPQESQKPTGEQTSQAALRSVKSTREEAA